MGRKLTALQADSPLRSNSSSIELFFHRSFCATGPILRQSFWFYRLLVVAVCAILGTGTAASGWATDGDERDSYICPIDRAATFPIGNDGKSSPRMYSDLEIPTQAYTNLVVACPKCGYAAWTGDFGRPVDAATESFVRTHLTATARRAAEDPVWAYKHHLQLLNHRNAPLRERIGANLFAAYVQKRRRPHGGSDATIERELMAIRREVIALLVQGLRDDPPRTLRTKLEWTYLLGELTRLVGDTEHARPLLAEACKEKDNLGVTLGRMACEQADKAAKRDTFEEYRDGVVNPVAAVAPKVEPPTVPAAPTPTAPK